MLQRLIRPLKGAVSHSLAQPTKRTIHASRWLQLPTHPTQATSIFSKLVEHIGGIIRTPVATRSLPRSPISTRAVSSTSARLTLASRPFGAPHLPRPPSVPGNITHVGLGTARNFSTGRPIFQHLVENVPVAGRAFYELDWDVKMRLKQRDAIRRHKTSSGKFKYAQKHHIQPISFPTIVSDEKEEEIQDYFQSPAAASVVTYLQIPLAPTPTSRVPLSSTPAPHLLPLPAIAKEHATHAKHGLRVSSLFRRLDAARVWDRGASCETYGDPSGLCTVLQVKFQGWTQEMVKEILGHAGKSWCIIEEVRPSPEKADSPVVDLIYSDPWINGPSTDSLIMPTIDVSEVPSTEETAADPLFSDGTESEFSHAPESAWDSDMFDVSTPPMCIADLDHINPEDEWHSISRESIEESVCFTPTTHQATLFVH